MKFSHQIQFTAVPDWVDYYLPYSNLKKLIYAIEKNRLTCHQSHDEEYNPTEQTALINNSGNSNGGNTIIEETNRRFINALNKYLDKIVKFYAKKETELYDEMDQLLFDFDRLNTPQKDPITLSSHPCDIGESTPHGTASTHRTQSSSTQQGLQTWHAIELKKRTIDLFVLLCELKSFVSLNLTAFFKIIKKYDKITDNDLKLYYLNNYVMNAFPFRSTTKARLDERIQETEHGYTLLATMNNKESAMEELRSHLREHIVWERNTVWKDMVGLERKTQTVELVDDQKRQLVWGPFEIDSVQCMHALFLVAATLVFVILLVVDIFGHVEQNRCFAILIYASLLWAGEVMPLFVTSLLVPFLIITLQVMRSNDEKAIRLDAPEATRRIFAAMFSPVIMLLLGGFALAGALTKFGIAKAIIIFVLSKSGTRPNRVLLIHMLMATTASMWISNVAAPILCYSLIQPILRTLPAEARFAPCLIMGIALASNLGGMASPISSPQNIIAIQNMSPAPTWMEWLMVSIPLCLAGNAIIWLCLIWAYSPEHQITHIHPIRAPSPRQPITWVQIYVTLVTLLTILMWCLATYFKGIFGDMGVVAILPLVAFFGPGLLSTDDFNHFLWDVVMLAMGGIALEQAVESSGLLATMAEGIESWVMGLSVFQVLVSISSLVLVLATFVSHTVAALIVLPIVAEVGARLDHPRLLVMGTTFICSCAMGLPVSGFPNMIAMAQENEFGTPYLSTKDFIRNGVPVSVYCTLCVTSLGYLLMKGVGF